MARVTRWARSSPALSAVLAAIVVVVLGFAAIGTARATDSPEFCRAACHEMKPYADAWEQGPHAGVSCVSCHVDDGVVERLKHKVVALGEVKEHIFGDPRFPLAEVTEVPDERCVRCHESVKVTASGFDHAQHASEGSCQRCHYTAGHDVTTAALEKAGVLSENTSPTAAPHKAFAASGKANLPGHVATSCDSCHDMAATGCDSCHDPRHEDAGPAAKAAACQTCHAPGTEFVFRHPSEGTCDSCHATPAEHRTGECTSCHLTQAKWDFSHPGKKAECTSCHEKPAGHSEKSCTTCHSSATSWAFSHPRSDNCTSCHSAPATKKHPRSRGCAACHSPSRAWSSATFKHPASSSDCATCHDRPAKHKAGSCKSCHSTGKSWKFKHPASSSKCSSCHNRPSGHASGSCSKCHASGRTWKFQHASAGKDCASCHNAPAKHYGSSCSSCHTPSKSWGSASFTHARIPGGEHMSRSFSCASCHPQGYSSYSCLKCHSDNKGGEKDDDDD